MTKLCGKPMPKAKNGADRGFCTHLHKHGGHCGNGTCSVCGIKLTSKNSYKKSRARSVCTACGRKYDSEWQKKYRQTLSYKSMQRKYQQAPKQRAKQKKLRQTPGYRAYHRRYQQTPKARKRNQEASSKNSLLKATKDKTYLKNGWPDAGLIEQKVGSDKTRKDQWRRAARLLSQGIVLKLLFASSHESAVHDKHKLVTFAEYAEQLGMSKEWKKLVTKERKIMELKKEYMRCDKCGTHNPCDDECKECGADLKVVKCEKK